MKGEVPPTPPQARVVVDVSPFPPRATARDLLALMLNDLAAWFGRYVYFRSPHASAVLALWVLHSHTLGYSATTPRLALTSALPGCGKTTALEHLERLTLNPMMGSHATPALIARIVSVEQTTVLLDETDNLLDKKREGVGDLVAVLNSGYRKGAQRPVLVRVKGGDWTVERMNTYAAVALAGIGDHLPEALLSRCIVIELDKATERQVEHTAWDLIGDRADALVHRLTLILSDPWVIQQLEGLAHLHTREVPGLFGRDREMWMPLLAVASVAGPDWYERALESYRWFKADADESRDLKPKTQRVQLLEDLHDIWVEEGRPSGFVPTSTLLSRLESAEPDAWGVEARYGQLKAKRLADLLNQYGVRPERDTSRTMRGYLWQDFAGPFSRYLSAYASNVPNVSDVSRSTHGADASDRLDEFPDTLPGVAL